MIAAKVARLSKTMAGKAAPAASMHIPSVVPYHTKPSDEVQGTRIHRLIDQKGTIVLPGCYDALSASIIEKSGFHAGYISGYSVSASLLGKPDIGFLTPPEMATASRTLCEAAPSVPFIADADTGGGSALNVTRTVKDLIKAGAAGCFLEDQAWPKKCGHMQGKQVIPADDHAAKIAAAREAIGDADFFLVARTDARATSAKYGLAEAISRANLYMDAGADACFVEAPRDEDELKEIARRTRGIRVCNMIEGGLTPMHTPEVFNKMGFHIIIYSTTMLYACSRAMLDVMTTLRETGTTKAHFNKMASFKDFNQLVNLDSWLDVEARFSSFQKDQPAKEASSSA